MVSRPLGQLAGRAIEKLGGRPVLLVSNLVFAAGLGLLAMADSAVGLFAAWIVIGIAMGGGLYEAAFSALVRLYGNDARNAITGITLIAGFASTVSWPLSTLMEAHWGWRGACVGWAALHLVLGFPLNWSIARVPSADAATSKAGANAQVPHTATLPSANPRLAAVLLSFVFAATWFTSTAMATHLPQLLQASGATLAVAVGVGALVGPAQVAGRLLEFGFLRRVHPLVSARLAALTHPVGAGLLLVLGAPTAAVFALLHGAGNGILTIAKGTLPLVLFGPLGYGARQGMLMMPGRIAQAFAPALFGLCLERWGAGSLWVTTGMGFMAFGALLLMPGPANTANEPPLAATTR